MSSSPAKIEANRANAQLSTGPQSPQGKAKSSLNAVKTGLTGRTVLLNTDDAAACEAHVKRFLNQYAPSTDEERALTYQLAETEWRLLCIPTLEARIYALGRREFSANFENEDPAVVMDSLATRPINIAVLLQSSSLVQSSITCILSAPGDGAPALELATQLSKDREKQLDVIVIPLETSSNEDEQTNPVQWVKRIAPEIDSRTLTLSKPQDLSARLSNGLIVVGKDVVDKWHIPVEGFRQELSLILTQGAGSGKGTLAPQPIPLKPMPVSAS